MPVYVLFRIRLARSERISTPTSEMNPKTLQELSARPITIIRLSINNKNVGKIPHGKCVRVITREM